MRQVYIGFCCGMCFPFVVCSIDKSKALSLILHCADISHPAKDWKLHYRWTQMLLEEFFKQVCNILAACCSEYYYSASSKWHCMEACFFMLCFLQTSSSLLFQLLFSSTSCLLHVFLIISTSGSRDALVCHSGLRCNGRVRCVFVLTVCV